MSVHRYTGGSLLCVVVVEEFIASGKWMDARACVIESLIGWAVYRMPAEARSDEKLLHALHRCTPAPAPSHGV